MFKNILLNKSEADKIPQITNMKGGTEGATENWENLFSTFEDTKGNKYLLCHGTEEGYLAFYGCAVNPYEVYRKLVKDGFIKKNEHLYIVCCYGTYVREMSMSKRIKGTELEYHDEFKESDYNFSFVNDTKEPGYVRKTKLNNGLYRFSIGTKESLFSKIKFEICSTF